MKCLYCHENVQPEGEMCPKCGLPLIEDTTLLEYGGTEKPSALEWINERKAILLAAAGGFAAAAAVGIVVIGITARPEPQVNEAMTPPPAPVQMASRGSDAPVNTSAPVTDGGTRLASLAMPKPPALAPASLTPARPAPAPTPIAPAAPAAPASRPDVDIAAPPPLPENFEYDPQWGFAAPPKPAYHRPRPVEDPEPTPPGHVLTMDPHRPRNAQFVTVVPNRGTVDGVTTILNGE